jgi:hypothetical protein
MPELCIIDHPLWNRVQSRLAVVGEKYHYQGRPGLAHRAFTSPNLLTGFLKCGVCGHNLTVVTGRAKEGQGRYGCPINFKRGACSNDLKQRAEEIEVCLFSQLQEAVLRPEAIDYAIQEFERQLRSSLDGLNDRIARMRQRSADLQHEIGNLAATAAQCGPTPALVREINVRQQELDDITRQILSAEPDSITAEIGRIRKFVTGQLGDIRTLLTDDVQKAKALLEKHVRDIRMVPQGERKNGYYIAEGAWNLLGGYGEEPAKEPEKRIRLVAGEGFEPSTFGL